ncbi:winged helix-turn-helix domain-containing protein, partial [candidate division WOR-3 bacterium]|nr:winged helix-turn-helix domain-containing protein [candidate division WOR-3 bacterium]
MKLSPDAARRIALNRQLLDGRTRLKKGKEGVADVAEHLGYVQIDTINVVARAHHHTLWTRRSDYSPAMLAELHSKDRRVFEYWGHGASYLPTSDYRYYVPMMRSFPDVWGSWTRNLYDKYKHLFPEILERIRKEGPLGSADFKSPDGKKRGTWWDWKPAKTALELLMWMGKLMVADRRNFQRIYDLTERVLPTDIDTSEPSPEEVARFRIRRTLRAQGIATEREILDYLHITSGKKVPDALLDLSDSGEVLKVEIDTLKDDYYVLADILEQTTRLRRLKPKLHLLSPFDNLVINRKRIEKLFNFTYTLECYTPAAKRKYGYFSLPILWGEEFRGRLDPKADRKEKVLIIRNIVMEEGFVDYDGFIPTLAEKLKTFAGFNGCEGIV